MRLPIGIEKMRVAECRARLHDLYQAVDYFNSRLTESERDWLKATDTGFVNMLERMYQLEDVIRDNATT